MNTGAQWTLSSTEKPLSFSLLLTHTYGEPKLEHSLWGRVWSIQCGFKFLSKSIWHYRLPLVSLSQFFQQKQEKSIFRIQFATFTSSLDFYTIYLLVVSLCGPNNSLKKNPKVRRNREMFLHWIWLICVSLAAFDDIGILTKLLHSITSFFVLRSQEQKNIYWIKVCVKVRKAT